MLTALLLSMTLGATGDIEAILKAPLIEADQPIKTKLATAILAVFPNAVTATVQRYYCSRDVENADVAKRLDLNCEGVYQDRVTVKDFVDLSIAGEVVKTIDGAPEGFVDVWKKAPRKNVPSGGDAWTATDELVAQAFVGLGAEDVLDFAFWRDGQDATKVIGRTAYFDVVNETTLAALFQAKAVHKAIRRVP